MKLHYKIKYGYKSDEFTIIEEDELDKAVLAWVTQRKVNLKNLMVDGKQIMHIAPDYHAAMGWNYGYELKPEDWAELRSSGVVSAYTGKIEGSKERVRLQGSALKLN